MPIRSQTSKSVSNNSHNIDVIGIVKRKFWIISFVMLVCIGLGLLYFFKAPKTYISEAKIFVEERNPVELNSSDGQPFSNESHVQEYVDKIKSNTVLVEAIKAAQLDDLPSMADADDVFLKLRDHLVVEPVDPSRDQGTISIAYQCDVPEDCEIVVQAICAAFEKYLKESKVNVGSDTANLMQELNELLSNKYTAVNDKIKQIKSKSTFVWIDGVARNPHQEQLTKLQSDVDLIRREQTKLSAQLKNIKEAIKKDPANRDAILMDVLQQISDDSLGAYVTTHQEYVRLKLEEQYLLGEYGADHPRLKTLRNQLKVADKLRMQELSALRGGVVKEGDTPPDFISVFIANLESKTKLLKTEEDTIKSAMVEEKKLAQAIVADVEDLYAAEREREILEKAMYAAADRLSEISLLKDYNWYDMQILGEPTPAAQFSPDLKISLASSLLLGLILGFGLAFLIELAEKRFHSSDEVANAFGERVIAHVQTFSRRLPRKKEYPNIGSELISLHRPTSSPSEAYRAVRTSIFFKAQESKLNTIQITSPVPGDGKSTTAANLAHVIAQSGRKVLLMDCDFRRPVVHQIFGLKNDIGMTSVIAGEVSAEHACRSTGVENLAILTSGPICSNPAELLSSDLFKNVLEEMREHFDFVIIDSPPLMAVTDPSIVASSVDSVFVVTRIRNGMRINAKQSRDVLDSVEAHLGGVIINGVEKKSSSSYSYDSGYRYGAYGSTYGTKNGNRAVTTNGPSNSNGQSSNGTRLQSNSRN